VSAVTHEHLTALFLEARPARRTNFTLSTARVDKFETTALKVLRVTCVASFAHLPRAWVATSRSVPSARDRDEQRF
jgi:hypothetical protein